MSNFIKIPLLWPFPAIVVSLMMVLAPRLWEPLKYPTAGLAVLLIVCNALICYELFIGSRNRALYRESGELVGLKDRAFEKVICAVSGTFTIALLSAAVWKAFSKY